MYVYLRIMPLPSAPLHRQNRLNSAAVSGEGRSTGPRCCSAVGQPAAHSTGSWRSEVSSTRETTFHGRTTLWQAFCSVCERWRKTRMSWSWIGGCWMPQLTASTRGIWDINHDLGHFWSCPKPQPVPLTSQERSQCRVAYVLPPPWQVSDGMSERWCKEHRQKP